MQYNSRFSLNRNLEKSESVSLFCSKFCLLVINFTRTTSFSSFIQSLELLSHTQKVISISLPYISSTHALLDDNFIHFSDFHYFHFILFCLTHFFGKVFFVSILNRLKIFNVVAGIICGVRFQ